MFAKSMFIFVVTFVETKSRSLMKYFNHFRRSFILRVHGRKEKKQFAYDIFTRVYAPNIP